MAYKTNITYEEFMGHYLRRDSRIETIKNIIEVLFKNNLITIEEICKKNGFDCWDNF